jgi:hypothetical protein
MIASLLLAQIIYYQPVRYYVAPKPVVRRVEQVVPIQSVVRRPVVVRRIVRYPVQPQPMMWRIVPQRAPAVYCPPGRT